MSYEFDYLVLGGGSAGCVVASRLSEDPDTRVALIEAGGSGDDWMVNVPAATVLMVPRKINNWAFETVPQSGLNGRLGYQPRGKVLGGSSAINAMVYVRGHRYDYDRWAELGCSGWSYAEVLPYFIKAENNYSFANLYHGNHGPLPVNKLRSDNPFQLLFLEAARQAGFNLNEDFNGAEQEGIGIYQVTQKAGERWSAARAYITPHLGKRENLRVELNASIQRILFEGKRAVGVELVQDGTFRTLRARREIILCCGAFQSPQLLMLSGIGDGAELSRLGIPVIQHLPGVGKNLQDHPDFIFGYKSSSLDLIGLSLSGSFKLIREILRYRRERRGMMTSNFAECGGFLKTRPELAAPDIQLHFVTALVEDHARKLNLGHGYSCHMCLLRPQSRGSVQLQSADPNQPPLIDPNFFGEEADLEEMVAGFKLARRLMDAPALAKMRSQDVVTAKVHSDDDIRAVLRQRVDTVYHPAGSCKMGVDAQAVVDPTLRVVGVEGLRVADASIMPTLIGGNTNAAAIMIGEKAAQFLKAGERGSRRIQGSAVMPEAL